MNSSAERPPWGKFRSITDFHRLEHHCADVAACFEALLRDRVLRQRFVRASATGDISPVTASRLTVLAFLHDVGKLNCGFQFKVFDREDLPPGAPPRAGHCGQEVFWCFQQERICEAIGLYTMFDTWGEGFEPLFLASLAHHGRPPVQPRSGDGPPELWAPFAGYDPHAAAILLGERIRSWFPDAFASGPPLVDSAALSHLFAGIVALADQTGSAEEFFRFEAESDPAYILKARERAEQAVEGRQLRRAGWPARTTRTRFQDLFDHSEPRPLQSAVQDAPLDRPLVILESETGSGKTEAAVLRFSALWHAGLVDGLYFAVPTRAAAKQLHGRVLQALRNLFPAAMRVETVLAIPGYHVAGEASGRTAERFRVQWEDEPDEETRLARWSAESSRHFMSAAAAVGTIDQALLAGLQAKWAHLRGSALARSLLVVDEVHASDPYMMELLRSVLRGHLSVGGHALLMSATLGAAARVRLADHRSRVELQPPAEMEGIPYPALTLAGGDPPVTQEVSGTGHKKTVSVRTEPILSDPYKIAEFALSAAQEGAKTLVIRNTVKEAQAVFGALQDLGGADLALQVGGGPGLHHSRFAAEDRIRLDRAVEDALGKGRGQGGVVVIGTQTLEQSLDIDADLLLSDMCPADVLLQRIGRLHRHQESQRPLDFVAPCCIVLVPDDDLESGFDGGLLRYGLGASRQGGGIYPDLLGLEATRRLIVEHPTWTIPDMNRLLVEQATHPQAVRVLAERLGGRWLESEQATHGFAAAERGLARKHVLDRSKRINIKSGFPDLDEKVRTRLGEDGPRIVLTEAVRGPFGRLVRTFNLPAHLFQDVGALLSKDAIDAAHADPTQDGLVLHVGHQAFRYDRLGVREDA